MSQDVQVKTIEKADLCVSCGMCLPHCPTYQLSRSEAESPRGRISLISALLKSSIEVDDTLLEHLDHCLMCRSCESSCPARVPFAEIMDETRAYLKPSRPSPGFFRKALLSIAARKKHFRFFVALLNYTGVRRILARLYGSDARGMGRYGYFLSQLRFSKKRKQRYNSGSNHAHNVALFTGCVQEYFDQKSIENAIYVLNFLGVNVHVPDQQQCCGSMHLHGGQDQQAGKMTNINSQVFNSQDIEAVVGLSSACTVTLAEAEKRSGRADLKYMDIVSYIESLSWPDKVRLNPIRKKILLHFPCTQQNVLKNTVATESFLRRIPGLQLEPQSGSNCCGAAGTYTLDYPEWSGQLKNSIVSGMRESQYDTIVTSNIGCAMQFRSLIDNNTVTEVCHPVDIMAQALSEK